ncbi:DEAD/DEAH box helicase [Methanopyrus sp. KOL6]|uniref:DEAD/DEAH box helicase n=1 Tax=Methanopyrus sp. KOL6 TaxID=1937004 RepID=UPI000B4B0825|nr:DEAD/DEAH box helicase [Methanopyrus sp. KOL6]
MTEGFEALPDDVQRVVYSRFKEPTPPQRVAIPEIIDGKNVLVIAPTSSGKTETAVLPVFSMVRELDEPGIKALYITPLRALNRDILRRIRWWGEKLGLEVAVRHGDTPQSERRRQAEDPPDVLLTTPETLQAILPGKRMREHLSHVRHVIVDEVNELAMDKRGVQLTLGLERLAEVAGDFQRIGLSAAVGSPDRVGKFLVGDRDVEVLEIEAERYLDVSVAHPTGPHEVKERLELIHELAKERDSVLVFTNTRQMAELLATRLKTEYDDVEVEIHHSSISREKRMEVEKRFKKGEIDILVCTSSLELGIDIGHVDLVIQYGSPRQVTRLTQRVGRAGRRRKRAEGLVITSNPDDLAEAAVICRRALKGSLEPTDIPEGCLDVLAHQLVGLCLDGHQVTIDYTLEVFRRAYPYRHLDAETLREVAEFLDDIEVLRVRGDRVYRTKDAWKYYYSNLSMIPDERHYRVVTENGGHVSVLDEPFVLEYLKPGIKFICAGRPWIVQDVDHDRYEVLVTPAEAVEGAIPSWVGEEIPVPYEVAREVGEGIGRVEAALEEGFTEAVEVAAETFGLGRREAKVLADLVRRQRDHSSVPLPGRPVIEDLGGTLVIHVYGGTNPNRTLEKVLGTLISGRLGTTVRTYSTPYKIVISAEKRAGLDADLLVECLETLPSDERGFHTLTLRIVEKSEVFKRRLVHVLKRFGAIEPDADYRDVSPRRLLKAFRGTPPYYETVSEVERDLDTSVAFRLVKELEEKAEIVRVRDPSPFAEHVLEGLGEVGRVTSGLLAAQVETLKRDLERRKLWLGCPNCGWRGRRSVRTVKEEGLKCPDCGATYLIAAKTEEGLEKLLKNPERAQRVADLLESYGVKALEALAVPGVGPEAAAKVLRSTGGREPHFYRELLQERLRYLRTRRFWN